MFLSQRWPDIINFFFSLAVPLYIYSFLSPRPLHLQVVTRGITVIAAAVLLSQSGSDTPGSTAHPPTLPGESPLMQRKASQRITAVEGNRILDKFLRSVKSSSYLDSDTHPEQHWVHDSQE